jgi:uncharacterized protein
MAFLLDVNVLIARVDPRHEHHERVLRWERCHPDAPLITCPLTENGFLRIYGHPGYPGGPGSPSEALVELKCLRALPVHRFVEDSISLAEADLFLSLKGMSPKQLSDLYLLGLAVRNGVSFATIDSKVQAKLVRGGGRALHVIDR